MNWLYKLLLPEAAFTGIRVGSTGTFMLTVGGHTTLPLPYNATQAQVDEAVERAQYPTCVDQLERWRNL